MGAPSGCVYAADHGLHVSSGVSVLPERVNNSTRLPPGTVPCQVIVPQVETVCASRV